MENQDLIHAIETGDDWDDQLTSVLADRSVIILDDDPTGTQTVHDVPVITTISEQTIAQELASSPVFFILTNSRSLQAPEAEALAREIGEIVHKLSKQLNKQVILISRSDSTLRGHYPIEVDALAAGLETPKAKHLIIPAFFEGGRYTFQDIHYVKEGERFVPAAQAPFAQDSSFGYQNSDLTAWISEKTEGNTQPEQIASISLEMLRSPSIQAITDILAQETISHVVVNACSYADLQVMAKACLASKETLMYRTAAGFVNAITGIQPQPILTADQLLQGQTPHGALIIVGSYVPKTSQQLAYLQEESTAQFVELKVAELLAADSFEEEMLALSRRIDQAILSGQDVVLYTSRAVITGESKEDSLRIVNQVSQGLIHIVKALQHRPRYILAKGGITSSDIATQALFVQRAMVLGQVIKGIPVWQLDTDSKFPTLPYIVFPGNVGGEKTLFDLVSSLTTTL